MRGGVGVSVQGRSWPNRVSAALLVAVGVIHLIPVVGVLSEQRLESLYGVTIDGGDLLILMRHRAVLFGIVGGLLLAAVWRRSLLGVAATAGLVSMLSFVAVAWLQGGTNAALDRVVRVDLVASGALLAALWLDRRAGEARPE